MSVAVAAAGEGGHAPNDRADLTDREAATAWGRGHPYAHDQADSPCAIGQIRCDLFWP